MSQTNPLPYKGEMFIVIQDKNGFFHVKNRDGCLGRTDQFIVAFGTMSKANQNKVIGSYQWPNPQSPTYIPINLEPILLTETLVDETFSKQFKAWLN